MQLNSVHLSSFPFLCSLLLPSHLFFSSSPFIDSFPLPSHLLLLHPLSLFLSTSLSPLLFLFSQLHDSITELTDEQAHAMQTAVTQPLAKIIPSFTTAVHTLFQSPDNLWLQVCISSIDYSLRWLISRCLVVCIVHLNERYD